MKTELLPAKYGSLIQPGNGAAGNLFGFFLSIWAIFNYFFIIGANKEFYYEYKEEKNPAGTYDKKDLHTVEV